MLLPKINSLLPFALRFLEEGPDRPKRRNTTYDPNRMVSIPEYPLRKNGRSVGYSTTTCNPTVTKTEDEDEHYIGD